MNTRGGFQNFLFLARLLLLLSLLSGCSTTLKAPKQLITLHSFKNFQFPHKPHTFEVNGKMGFSDGKKGGNGSIFWQQVNENYKIRLYGPLGSGSLQIEGDHNQIILTKENGVIIQAKNPETLVESELGWKIPISNLRFWILGIPAPGNSPTQIQIDKDSHLWVIKQQGWTITYQGYRLWHNQTLPTKLSLKNGPLQLKLILSDWNF